MGFPTRQIGELAGHGGAVNCVTFSSAAGQYILTGCADRFVRLYNASTYKLVQTYTGAHAYSVLDICVSASNGRFASVGGDKSVFLWDVTTGKTLRRLGGLHGHEGRVNTACFGAKGSGIGQEGVDEEVLITGSQDASVRLWDLKSSNIRPIQMLKEAKDSVTSVAAVDYYVITGSLDGRLRTYDIRMGMLFTDAIGHPVTSLFPSPMPSTSALVLISSHNGPLHLFDRVTGMSLQKYTQSELQNGEYRIRAALAFADRYVISGSENGRLFVWDTLKGIVTEKLDNVHAGKVVSAVAVRTGISGRRADAGIWVSAGSDGTVVVWGQ